MDSFFRATNGDATECPFDENDILRCPFLRNISKPTSFSFSSVMLPNLARGARGPIFEDGPNFGAAFMLFHGKDGVVPLSNACNKSMKSEPAPQFNPLAASAATISLSALGIGGPFSFGPFNEMWKNQKKNSDLSNKREFSPPKKGNQKKNSELSNKREFSPPKKGNSSKHEAQGDEWLETGNCPIAKSYRAVNHVLPLVAKVLQPPAGLKYKCPPAIVAARAALARTAFVKNLRPHPLHEKMFVIAALGMAVNVPLGVWREHTVKFSLAWFVAVHAAVPFIAMLRKSVLMPKAAMVMTIAASILGQVIGSRAERYRMKAVAYELSRVNAQATAMIHEAYTPNQDDDTRVANNNCGTEGMVWDKLPVNINQAGGLHVENSSCGTEGMVWDKLPVTPPANICY